MTSAAPDTDQLLDGLNPEQRQAVQHAGSPLLIVAGAGSGKTAVLTRRIAYLLGNRDVGVGQILAITFTNKAAAEMRERVVQLIGPQAKSMWVSTFHSTCVRILRNQASLLPGLNSNFSIYDADDSRRLLMMVAKDLNFRHILVDEYQDTNHAQYVLVRELVGHHAQEGADDVPPAELCVVGDADQSIYAFRGATIRNIEDFERDFPNAKTILLEQNYRSTQNILSAANGV
ncbi:UvrD-helicase domain-containing protein, partial [Mycolicibacterium sp. CBMA 361]|uniref:ATP-dependent helicase n=1 Tax=Mycolicibacterium sp. CBMA 361 TaxID=2606610 RepID=UPI0012DDFB09